MIWTILACATWPLAGALIYGLMRAENDARWSSSFWTRGDVVFVCACALVWPIALPAVFVSVGFGAYGLRFRAKSDEPTIRPVELKCAIPARPFLEPKEEEFNPANYRPLQWRE